MWRENEAFLNYYCKTRENFIFSEKWQNGNFIEIVQAKNRNFSKSRMTKQTYLLKSSCEFLLPRRISSNFEVVGISRFSKRGVSDDSWWNFGMSHGTPRE